MDCRKCKINNNCPGFEDCPYMVDFPNEADAERVDAICKETRELTAAIKAGKPFHYQPVRPDRKCGFCKEFEQHSSCETPFKECDCPKCDGYCSCC